MLDARCVERESRKQRRKTSKDKKGEMERERQKKQPLDNRGCAICVRDTSVRACVFVGGRVAPHTSELVNQRMPHYT